MDAAVAFKTMEVVQGAFRVMAALHLTNYLWPREAVVRDGASFDFIIVGAGTAGNVIANRLSEIEHVNVLLIEAGGDPPFESDLPGLPLLLKRSRYDWNFTSNYEGSKDSCHLKNVYEITQGKMLGGTSSLNYMVYHKGQPSDYNSWAERINDESWKWDNVLPYFKKFEKLEDSELLNSVEKEYYGVNGYIGLKKDHREMIQPFLNSYREVGNDIVVNFNEHQTLGFGSQIFTASGRSRQSSAYAFLSSAKDRRNLHVLKNSLVTKINFDDSKRAIGVEVLTKDGKTQHFKAIKEVIISAGTFNTPKLLMLSGIGPEEHLQSKDIKVISNLPVGENLQEHIGIVHVDNMDKLTETWPQPSPYELPGASYTGFVALNKSSSVPDYQVISYIAPADVVLFYCTFCFRYSDEICNNIHIQGVNRLQAFTQIMNLAPKSRGKVLLRSNNPEDPPLINNGFLSDKSDIEALIDYTIDNLAVMNTTYYRNVDAAITDAMPECNEFRKDSREFWRCYIKCLSIGLSEFTSTCPMGTVVDSRLLVNGVTKLRVVDASVMPTITRANPVAAVLMIGEKASDMIKKDHNLI